MCIPQVRPNTQKAQEYVFILKILVFIQLVISCLNFVIQPYYIKLGVFGIFLSFCLFLSLRMLYYHLLLANIIIGLYFSCEYLFAILDYFQKRTDLVNAESSVKFNFSVIVISLVFYALSSIFYYYPYIQFKTIEYKENPALEHIFETHSASEAGKIQRQVPYELNYGPITITAGKRNNDNGIYQIGRGQGIKI